MEKIKVQNTEVSIIKVNGEDYICLTDMVRPIENGLALIEKWLRNKNTLEFLGVWKTLYNPVFKSPEFEGIRSEAGLNRFIISAKQWSPRLERQARVVEDKLPHSHECHQPKSHSAGIVKAADLRRVCKRSRCAQHGVVRHHRQAMARGEPRFAGQYAGLRRRERVDLPVKHGKSERGVHRTEFVATRTPDSAQQNRHPSNANSRIQQKPPDTITAGRDLSRPLALFTPSRW